MVNCYVVKSAAGIPIKPLTVQKLPGWLGEQTAHVKAWVKASGFKAKPDTLCLIPSSNGSLERVLLGVTDTGQYLHFGVLAAGLPAGIFSLDPADFKDEIHFERALLAFGLGSYQFTAYRDKPPYEAQLVLPSAYRDLVNDWVTTIYWVRDLINTPAEDMGPSALAEAAKRLASEQNASIAFIEGEELKKGFPAVYAVGRAGHRPPVFIDLQWGDEKAPRVTLVGKGVCFDTGGLDIKPSAGMLTMKKDMGGAAHALGLGRMIMQQKLPVRLRILIPAVENAIGSSSYRPGDVLRTRAGKTVEVNNTDAEGRLVLCDALAEAAQESPELLIDFATLTGAARVALGPELSCLFCNQEELAEALLQASNEVRDPLWRLPLHAPYRNYMRSEIADFTNCGLNGMAGAIVAALFLQYFVLDKQPWVHFDLFAWNTENSPSRPFGGEAMALRAVFHYLRSRFR